MDSPHGHPCCCQEKAQARARSRRGYTPTGGGRGTGRRRAPLVRAVRRPAAVARPGSRPAFPRPLPDPLLRCILAVAAALHPPPRAVRHPALAVGPCADDADAHAPRTPAPPAPVAHARAQAHHLEPRARRLPARPPPPGPRRARAPSHPPDEAARPRPRPERRNPPRARHRALQLVLERRLGRHRRDVPARVAHLPAQARQAAWGRAQALYGGAQDEAPAAPRVDGPERRRPRTRGAPPARRPQRRARTLRRAPRHTRRLPRYGRGREKAPHARRLPPPRLV
ncbi:hypothetical protein DFH09DRAFT_1509497, partial [Mycena vulgaris]